MIQRLAPIAIVTLVGLLAGAGLYRLDHGGGDWVAVALEREAALRLRHPGADYGTDDYRGVQQALQRVPLWSPQFTAARAWDRDIALARRERAGRRYPQLGDATRWAPAGMRPVARAADVDGDGEPQPTAEPAADEPKVTVYMTSWCPYCRKIAAHLQAQGVTFRERNVERDPAAAEELARKAPYALGVPVVDVAGSLVLGYDPAATDQLLREAGLLPRPKDS